MLISGRTAPNQATFFHIYTGIRTSRFSAQVRGESIMRIVLQIQTFSLKKIGNPFRSQTRMRGNHGVHPLNETEKSGNTSATDRKGTVLRQHIANTPICSNLRSSRNTSPGHRSRPWYGSTISMKTLSTSVQDLRCGPDRRVSQRHRIERTIGYRTDRRPRAGERSVGA